MNKYPQTILSKASVKKKNRVAYGSCCLPFFKMYRRRVFTLKRKYILLVLNRLMLSKGPRDRRIFINHQNTHKLSNSFMKTIAFINYRMSKTAIFFSIVVYVTDDLINLFTTVADLINFNYHTHVLYKIHGMEFSDRIGSGARTLRIEMTAKVKVVSIV